MYHLLSLALIMVFATSCAPFIMVQARRDYAYQLNKDLSLYVDLRSDVSVQEKNTYNIIKEGLLRSGFRTVDKSAEAKLILTFSMADDQYLYETYDPWPYYDTWPYSRWYYRSYWQPRPRLYVRDRTVVRLRLFDAQSFKEGHKRPLWEGVVYADSDTLEAKLAQSLNFLVEKIGVDYQGRVRLRD